MTRPWRTVDRVHTDEGVLELRMRGEHDFLMTVGGRVLMSSTTKRSEIEVAHAACARICSRRAPRVLIGGLGMGFTLRAALDELPADATVEVAEITEQVVTWCHGPLAALSDHALSDPRVHVVVVDVAEVIEHALPGRYAAIVLDLYEGPHQASQDRDDPFYGPRALATTCRALAAGGVLSVWSEEADTAFERRLRGAGFDVEKRRPRSGGRRHVVYLAVRPS